MDHLVGKFVKFISFAFAALMLFISVAAAVWGYDVVDSSDFRLVIGEVVVDTGTVSFDLYNRGVTDFDYTNLRSYKISVKDGAFESRFAHSTDEPLAVIGFLKSLETQHFDVPYSDAEQPLMCGQPVSVELYSVKGRVIGAWTGIPKCEIQKPRPVGLVKLSATDAEYKSGSLTISWELVDADPASKKVLLTKRFGLLKPETAWYSESGCPDVESGKCMTTLSLYFTCDYVNVRLDEGREGTSVILTKMFPASEVVVGSAEEPGAEAVEAETAADEQVRVCLEGCPADNQCFEAGMQHTIIDVPVYCEGHSWLVQKKEGKRCAEDHECVSQSCDGVCGGAKQQSEVGAGGIEEDSGSQTNIVYRVLQWIDNLM